MISLEIYEEMIRNGYLYRYRKQTINTQNQSHFPNSDPSLNSTDSDSLSISYIRIGLRTLIELPIKELYDGISREYLDSLPSQTRLKQISMLMGD
jgi:hypothetical protein